MKLIFPFVLACIFLISFCSTKTEQDKQTIDKNEVLVPDSLITITNDSLIDTTALEIRFKPSGNYTNVKTKSTTLRNSLKTVSDSLKKIAFENLILNELIPHWYGTKWDFSGYTDAPNQGVIACGYFVSTVLKHAGFNLNRYKLAQQDPLNEAKTVACGDSVDIYEVNSTGLQEIFKQKYEEGLYFVGLDFHVGFLLFRNKELYFIHSNYIGAEGVIFEKAVYSDAFNAAQKYRIAKISTNKKLLNDWLGAKEIKIVSE